jgi:hypothetical protein
MSHSVLTPFCFLPRTWWRILQTSLSTDETKQNFCTMKVVSYVQMVLKPSEIWNAKLRFVKQEILKIEIWSEAFTATNIISSGYQPLSVGLKIDVSGTSCLHHHHQILMMGDRVGPWNVDFYHWQSVYPENTLTCKLRHKQTVTIPSANLFIMELIYIPTNVSSRFLTTR